MAATLIQKSGHLDVYDARIKNQWLMTYGTAANEFERIFGLDSITTEDTRTSWQTGFGLAVETGENEAFTYDTITQGYDTTCTPYQYTLGYQVSEIAVEDDPTGIIKGAGLAAAHADAIRESVEQLAIGPLNSPTSTTAFSPWMSGGDGVALLSTAHPFPSGGTFSNKPSTDCDISPAALEAAQINLAKTPNPRGQIRGLVGKTLVVPPDSKFLAQKILYTTKQIPFSADYTSNPVAEGIQLEVLSRMVVGSGLWLLLANKAAKFGQHGHTLTWLWRVKPEFGRDNVFATGARQYKARFRSGIYYPDSRGVYGSTGL
jgi:hypothetical protein